MSAIARAAVTAPAAAGLNSTDTVQVDPAANEPVQVVADFTNEAAAVPVMVSEVRVRAAVPEFLIVTVCAAEVAPFNVVGKAIEVGVSVTAGAIPVPVRVTD